MLDMPREAGDNKESEGTHRHPTLQTLCDLPRLPWTGEDVFESF